MIMILYLQCTHKYIFSGLKDNYYNHIFPKKTDIDIQGDKPTRNFKSLISHGKEHKLALFCGVSKPSRPTLYLFIYLFLERIR